MTDPMLDMSIEAMSAPRREWRVYGIGCGDLGKLFLSLGRRDRSTAPRWLRDETEPMKRRGNTPRFLLEKAGRLARLKKGDAAQTGLDREAELFLTWCAQVENGEPGADGGLGLEPSSLFYAGALPREWPPMCDPRLHPRLVARIDAWARTTSGALVLPSLKLARYGIGKPAWWNNITSAPWYYELQCQGEMAVSGAAHALMVIGCGWIRDSDDPRPDGEIKVLRVDRDESLIREIRDAVDEGWREIERLRAA